MIAPIPKNPHPSENNDYRPVALTSIVMKCFSDDMAILSLLYKDQDISSYQSEIEQFVEKCDAYHLTVNVKKTEEIIFDPKSRRSQCSTSQCSHYRGVFIKISCVYIDCS